MFTSHKAKLGSTASRADDAALAQRDGAAWRDWQQISSPSFALGKPMSVHP